ncbi:MAG: putative rane protein [Planctomycetaceae bacterium]|nr:putative rane protein [Planctomycetaceae bacterium]
MIQYDAHNWFEHLLDIKGSMFREIIGRVLTCVAWAAVVCVLNQHASDFFRLESLGFPDTAHGLIGSVLGLLLVFRTNASYDRFWEGRKIWGAMINDCRNLARLSKIWMQRDQQLANEICEWITVYPWMVMRRLRGTQDDGTSHWNLDPVELSAVLKSKQASLEVAGKLSRLLLLARDRGLLSELQLIATESNVQRLVDYLGGCERIQNTPLPFAYMVHLRRALIVYCFTLPFALLDKFHWGTVVVVLLISYLMFGIEEIGVEIENPFGIEENDLPLERLCETIQRDVRAL